MLGFLKGIFCKRSPEMITCSHCGSEHRFDRLSWESERYELNGDAMQPYFELIAICPTCTNKIEYHDPD